MNQIAAKIQAYHGGILGDQHHRYRSWEHCYAYFRRSPTELAEQRDSAAIQLGFYLASWGMYRGSSFLLQRAYTVHLGVIERLAAPKFLPLWNAEFGSDEQHVSLIPIVLSAIQDVREAYAPFGQASDTLVTKVLLGTFGCLPACDRYFIAGFKNQGHSFSYLNDRFVQRIVRFCRDNLVGLRSEQDRIRAACGLYYPLMKLVDMYFWQIGYELAMSSANPETEEDQRP